MLIPGQEGVLADSGRVQSRVTQTSRLVDCSTFLNRLDRAGPNGSGAEHTSKLRENDAGLPVTR
jgi:hypothetical protein